MTETGIPPAQPTWDLVEPEREVPADENVAREIFRPNYVRSLINLSRFHSAADNHPKAVQVALRAAEEARPLFAQWPARFAPLLSDALHELARHIECRISSIGLDAALEPVNELVDLHHQVPRIRREGAAHILALYRRAKALHDHGRVEAARADHQSALECVRELDPRIDSFRLTSALDMLAGQAGQFSWRAEAGRVVMQLVAVLESLAACEEPMAHASAFAVGLSVLLRLRVPPPQLRAVFMQERLGTPEFMAGLRDAARTLARELRREGRGRAADQLEAFASGGPLPQ